MIQIEAPAVRLTTADFHTALDRCFSPDQPLYVYPWTYGGVLISPTPWKPGDPVNNSLILSGTTEETA